MMAPWLQSTLVYGFLGASLAFGLLRLRPGPRTRGSKSGLGVAPGLALAAPFALEQGGPGVLVWSLVGIFGGWCLRQTTSPRASTRPGRAAELLFYLSTLALSGVLAAFIGEQGLVVLRDIIPDTRVWSGLLRGSWLFVLAAIVLMPLALARRWLPKFTLAATLAWLALCAVLLVTHLADTGSALSQAFEAAAQSSKILSSPHQESQSLLAALFCMGSAGIVSAMWAQPSAWQGGHQSESHQAPTKLARWAPWLSAAGLSMSLLVLLSAQQPHQARIDAPELRNTPAEHLNLELANQTPARASAQDEKRGSPRWLPLERPHARSFAATSLGQSVVLPQDSPLKNDEEYKLLFRSNPRGSKIGKLTPKGNGLFIPYPWRTLHKVTHLRFRDKNPKRSPSSAWDLRIPVDVTLLGSEASPRGVVYTPKNPKVVLKDLSESMEGPYIELEDQQVIASPQRMHSSEKDLGVHNALLGFSSHPENTFVPNMRDLVGALRFRGPYLSGHPGTRPPFAMAADQAFQGERNSQRELVLRSPPRGLAVGDLQADGSYTTPPWEHLAKAKAIRFRHRTHPHLDLEIPASVKLRGGRLHFYPDSVSFSDLRKLSRDPNYEGPFLMAPDYRFTVEVHAGTNFPDVPGTPSKERGLKLGPLASRASLVPLHELSEPVGGQTELYRPHPAELAFTDAQGPFLVSRGASWLLRSFGEQGTWLRTLAQGVLLALMAAGLFACAASCARSVRGLLGNQSRLLGSLIALSCAALGSFTSWAALSHALLLAATLTFFTQLLASLLGRARGLTLRGLLQGRRDVL